MFKTQAQSSEINVAASKVQTPNKIRLMTYIYPRFNDVSQPETWLFLVYPDTQAATWADEGPAVRLEQAAREQFCCCTDQLIFLSRRD